MPPTARWPFAPINRALLDAIDWSKVPIPPAAPPWFPSAAPSAKPAPAPEHLDSGNAASAQEAERAAAGLAHVTDNDGALLGLRDLINQRRARAAVDAILAGSPLGQSMGAGVVPPHLGMILSGLLGGALGSSDWRSAPWP